MDNDSHSCEREDVSQHLGALYASLKNELDSWKNTGLTLYPFYNELRYAARHIVDYRVPLSPIPDGADRKEDSDKAERHLRRLQYDMCETRMHIAVEALENQKQALKGKEHYIHSLVPDYAAYHTLAINGYYGEIGNPKPLPRRNAHFLEECNAITGRFNDLAGAIDDHLPDIRAAARQDAKRNIHSWGWTILSAIIGLGLAFLI